MTAAGDPVVTVVTVPGCHLCSDAIAVVSAVCGEAAASWREQDLWKLGEDDVRRWRDLVPVVLVDDEVVDTLRCDAVRLKAALTR